MPDIQPVQKIKGKYAVVSFIENYDDEETEEETIIEAANDEVTYGGDEEVLESDDQLGVEITQREVIGGAPFIELGHYLTPDSEVLQEAGVMDEDGSWTTAGREIEAARVRFYESSDLEALALVVDGVGVEPEWSDDASFPADGYGEAGLTLHCNDDLIEHTDDLDTEFGLTE